jgi:hypothetical protein
MAKVINITDKLSKEKPKIQIGEKFYEVDNSMSTMLKFQSLTRESTEDSLSKSIELALGSEVAKELNVTTWCVADFKVLSIALMAAMQDIEYGEAEARFLQTSKEI